METQSYRKPYIRPVKRGWWLQRRKYILYMIREATAFVNLWVAVELTAIILAAAFVPDAAQRIDELVTHPAVIAFHIVALLATIMHTVTWYHIFPSGVRWFTSRDPANTKLVPAALLTASLYFVTAVASVLIVLAFLFA